ncbi:MAG: ornithine cyclodeaminase family protein [Gemmatimonadetes bacterium]|nr:ornithine cyclodeaminase family protein [Gemmatimonadota bacterium]
MSVLTIGPDEVRRNLPMAECIDLMADALAALTRGEVIQPLRTVLRLPPDHDSLLCMPAFLANPRALAVKLITLFPGNAGTSLETHQGSVLLFDPDRGNLLAWMDAGAITAIRTAAVSGLATRWLARRDAGDLGILGSGVQARTHLEAMLLVRSIRRLRVWSPNEAHRLEFATDAERNHNVRVEPVASAREAVERADIICTTTASGSPVLRGEWLMAGAHINAVGASTASTRELDSQAVRRARLYVDRRESALHEAGDFLIPKAEGLIGDDHIVGELGEVVSGRTQGRRTPDEITLFKSLGMAVEDAAAARLVYERITRG